MTNWTTHPTLPTNDNSNGGIEYRYVSGDHPGITKMDTSYDAKDRGPDAAQYIVGCSVLGRRFATLAEARKFQGRVI